VRSSATDRVRFKQTSSTRYNSHMNPTSTRPIAYHITFGTYGTRLHGDPRGTVDRKHNKPGEPIIGKNTAWERYERNLLRFEPVILTSEQRHFIEQYLPDVCERGGWKLHLAAAQHDHVHCLISTPSEGKTVRRLMKRWLGQALSDHWPKPDPAARWWADGGSVKWIWEEDYFERAWHYINQQRATQSQ